MSATVAGDFVFEPKVWKDHIAAYFDRKLVYGAFADRDDTLVTSPGLTVNFPYFKKVGDAEEPGESDSLIVDNLEDDSFSATVKEIGKAVGFKKKAFKKSAADQNRIMSECQQQIARVHAEKVDKDLLTEFSSSGNFVNGYTATLAAHTMNVRSLFQAKVVGLGDRADEAEVVFMHSKQAYDLMSDSTAGFLKADANDPLYGIKGFMGRILGMAVVAVDSIPATSAQINSTNAYRAFIHTAMPYGFLKKQEVEIESDYDILAREWVVTGNEWYAVKSYHSKIAADNYRTVEVITTVSI